jgi:hypothetical protein
MASTTSPDDLVEVIRMESATVFADVRVELVSVPRCGRFSTGIERLPETSAKQRSGRFSTGIERLPETPGALRLGSFADGFEHVQPR